MIKFENVTKRYGRKEILHSISLNIPKGKIVSIIGRSGCGKTTMLKMINRLVPITSGHILVNEKNILNMNPVDLRRNIGYVIQQIGLFPHMTVHKNLELVLALHQYPKRERKERIDEIMDKMGLTPDLLNHYPIELSGGQQQRIGVARALITDPEVILMDEPFSALDPLTRIALQDDLKHLQNKLQKTIVFVTHDMDEAIKISDYICLMREGHIEEYDTTETMLRHPATPFVENFIGKHRIWNSPEFIKAKDIMRPSVNTCYTQDSLERCLKKVQNTSYPYIIVIDPKTKKFRGFLDINSLQNKKAEQATASDIMYCPPSILHVEDTLTTVLHLIKESPIHYMVVLNDQETVAGVITQRNLLKALGEQYTTETEVM
ncbi:ABC transporter ATPase [Megasphaera cerevisiae DSM 20462]|jgi:osmoprotectant transport system ATP-binding protein|uniref:Quaternary amine transport ATP-binding protein n=1 Tax=Megasphaera cerevisiae DSM 20462 TaxID=1122219 RepID=A0A0J6WUZ1_9FIRM|nr:betaine/proline/choline family ABC transporter ATP-binding protein [Megasphaera cerevisiae]KMO85592.1 ABC transporter ATPase [Megasphaera cerevisiae DSM 20462]OKY53149.1 proline/glycine betaine ABC transporter ATP-binding protein [Megasphaera cerevisiae]SKA15192.1 osmoprotectant transport system ATP-binding protein [Megasphaera cerevisiae DSM 20462]